MAHRLNYRGTMTVEQLGELRLEYAKQLDRERTEATRRIGPLEETLVEIDRRIAALNRK
jgi:hypothetical protein